MAAYLRSLKLNKPFRKPLPVYTLDGPQESLIICLLKHFYYLPSLTLAITKLSITEDLLFHETGH